MLVSAFAGYLQAISGNLKIPRCTCQKQDFPTIPFVHFRRRSLEPSHPPTLQQQHQLWSLCLGTLVSEAPAAV